MDSDYLNNSIYVLLLELLSKEQPCILSTVTETFGSTPQKAGSSAIVGISGLIAGTVGGGISEQQIIKKAKEAISVKKSCYCRFDLNNAISEEETGICGGDMQILMDASPEKHMEVFRQLKESIENRNSGVLVSIGNSDEKGEFVIQRYWVTRENLDNVLNLMNKEAFAELEAMLQTPVQGEFRKQVKHTSPEYEDNFVFLETIMPKPRLIIAGAGHVGKALSHYGKLLDFEVTVWDNRKDKTTKSNLPDADEIRNGDMGKSFSSLIIDRNTFVVIATYAHKFDADVLKLIIDSQAGYIGMIGSKRKVAQIRENFIQNGWANVEKWNKIHAPIGMDIHSKTVQEIALSIAAQLVKVRYELNHG